MVDPSIPPPTSLLGRSVARRAGIDAGTFEAAFGEPLSRALDLRTWKPGDDFGAMLAELRREIGKAVVLEEGQYETIRRVIFPAIERKERGVKGAGVYRAKEDDLAKAHHSVLLNGGVEACAGSFSLHDALPLTIIRLGICLVAYNGRQNHYSQQFFRRDFALTEQDVVDAVLDALERRRNRDAMDAADQRDALSELSRRGILAYMVRAVLARESRGIWRMGDGSPIPLELLTGSGSIELFQAGIELVRELVGQHRRFVFIPSTVRERDLLTIGQALQPLEFAIIDTMEDRLLQTFLARQNFGPSHRDMATRFIREVGSQIAIGLYRVSAAAPAMIFYAHVDHAAEAALIAMADSALQAHRGFPLLLDLADRFCESAFGGETLRIVAREAYADAGAPYRYG